MSRGLILGRFLPPHRGHLALCDFAKAYGAAVTIVIAARPTDTIAGATRKAWMEELNPSARVVVVEQDLPLGADASADVWSRWQMVLAAVHPEPVDLVFSSHAGGSVLAKGLDARFVPFDPGHDATPLTSQAVRANPYAHWDSLPPPVRAHYVKTVCLFGPESTGKSTLAKKLRAHYRTIAAPEYGRIYCETFGTHCTADDLRAIVKGQAALEAAAKRQSGPLLILDTDRLMTALWTDMLLGTRPADLDNVAELADFYVMPDIDIPWADDGTRYFPGDEARQRFYACCRRELERRALPFATIQGEHDARFAAAVAVIDAAFPELCGR